MNTLQQSLNLARKWRPQSFDQVVGQEVSVRMLKNGLFLNKFFPVYLFAGQRGCGKTSTARIFAAAINCIRLQEFQKKPADQAIPCLVCDSCTSMINGNHPDFIEIDAASHTGVDNVRQIIESSSYMPLIGRKKIYLIDEAHMLSKAAFNAFLKILEEPPVSVVFILATTETPKIPATVLSRCFQVMFNPINNTPLKKLLHDICSHEQVAIEDGAIDLIINETEGSARDAINLLERVRFSGHEVTEQVVLNVLGKISIKDLVHIFDLMIDQTADQVLLFLQKIDFQQRSPQLLWDMIVSLCRTIMWIKYGVQPTADSVMTTHHEQLKLLASKCSINRLNAILNLLWTQEELFMKTNKKHIFLEMTLLNICQQVNVVDLEDLIKACGAPAENTAPNQVPRAALNTTVLAQPEEKNIAAQAAPIQPVVVAMQPEQPREWKNFLESVAALNDALLSSIFMQAAFVDKNSQTRLITIQLSVNSTFFRKKIEETQQQWLPIMIATFGDYNGFSFTYQAAQEPPAKPPYSPPPPPSANPPMRVQQPQQAPAAKQNYYAQRSRDATPAKRSTEPDGEPFIIKDAAGWPLASLILRHFSGKIRKVKNLPA